MIFHDFSECHKTKDMAFIEREMPFPLDGSLVYALKFPGWNLRDINFLIICMKYVNSDFGYYCIATPKSIWYYHIAGRDPVRE